jgi:hypothetical protein
LRKRCESSPMNVRSCYCAQITVIECSPDGVCFSLSLGVCAVELNVCEVSALSMLIMGSICDCLSRWKVCRVVLFKKNTILTSKRVAESALTRK